MGNTVYLNGLNNLNCCLENSNNVAIPIQGLGDAFGIANNIKKIAANGGNTIPAQKALTTEIKKAADKIIGKTAIIPQVNPSLVNPNQPKTPVVNNAITDFKRAVIAQKSTCKTNCATPSRVMPGIDVKVGSQTGTNKKQIRKFNAAELNVMTRVIVEPMRKSLEATLQNLNDFPAQNAVYYNVPVYKAFITEMLQNWSNPVAIKAIIAKYRGKINNTQTINKMAMVAGLSGYNGLNGLFDWAGDVVSSIGDGFKNAAKWAGNMTSNIYDSVKAGVDITFDMINKAGAAIGEGIKNAAKWTIGMLQKYNPLMIIARQAFRGLLAINFRGWASDMQGMRDRGEGDKIKDTWTGTFVGGDWGDLVSAINTGAGRDMKKAETATVELTPETINTIEPFDWVGGQKDGLGFHTVAKHTLKAGDEISINVLIGDKSYNGVHKVKYIGDDEGKQKDNFFVLNIAKKGGASGTFQFADEFSRMNDLWKVGIDPNSVQKGVIDTPAGQPKQYRYTGSDIRNSFGLPIVINNQVIGGNIVTKNILGIMLKGIDFKNGNGQTFILEKFLTDANIGQAVIPNLPKLTPITLPNVPTVPKPLAPLIPTETVVIKQANGKQVTLKKNIFTNTIANAKTNSLKGLGSLGAEPVTTGATVTAASPIIATMTSIMTSVGVSASTAASIAAGVATGASIITAGGAAYATGKALYDKGKEILDPSSGSNNGGGSSVPKGINPQLPGGPPNNSNLPQPATPSNPSGNNNANNGGGNSKILLIGGAIAAVVVFALLSNKSNAAPKSNLNGLNGTKTVGERSRTTKTKTVNNFKL